MIILYTQHSRQNWRIFHAINHRIFCALYIENEKIDMRQWVLLQQGSIGQCGNFIYFKAASLRQQIVEMLLRMMQ